MNITEFAKAAGVSKSAVSRYFNDGYVSEEKPSPIKASARGEYCMASISESFPVTLPPI